VVDQGVVYFGGWANSPGVGKDDGYLFAVDAKTGQEKWRFPVGNVAAPAIGDGRVYILGGKTTMRADVADFHGILYAVDLQTGKEVWHVEAPRTSEMSGSFGDPIYYQGRVYAAASFDAFLGPGHVYAFDARTGQEVWKQTTADDLWNPETPAAYNGAIYVVASAPKTYPRGTEEAPLYVFDAQTGAAKWTFRAGQVISEPAISQGTLYIASTAEKHKGALYALDPATGEQRDKLEAGDALYGRPAIVDGTIYVEGGPYQDVLIAVRTHAATTAIPGSPDTIPLASPTP
jgi:outer membrane protein assembly factor BamB